MNNPSVLTFASDRSILIRFGSKISEESNSNVIKVFNALLKSNFDSILSIHPAYNSILVTFDVTLKSPFEMMDLLKSLVESDFNFISKERRLIEIPVCYDEEFAPDIMDVAKHNNMTREQVIYYHTLPTYRIYFFGFSPGFPYLGGMLKEIATPRLNTPRIQVPEGSVAIGGEQTGIYPVASPGGWRIIGRTPLKLFSLEKNPPTFLQIGDEIKFVQITREKFREVIDAQDKSY